MPKLDFFHFTSKNFALFHFFALIFFIFEYGMSYRVSKWLAILVLTLHTHEKSVISIDLALDLEIYRFFDDFLKILPCLPICR